jgi:large subunit ribosomal protein L7Ae
LSIPPAINQFSFACEKSQAVDVFKLLKKYAPESKTEKAERRAGAAEAGGEVAAPGIVLKYGLKHVTSLIEDKKAKLVVIASDVDPIELVVWMPALCRKMGVPYCIVKNSSRLGTLVHQKRATAVALTGVNKEDASTLQTLCDSFASSFTEAKQKWTRANKPIMGLKTQTRLEKRQQALEAEMAKKRKTGAI